MCGRFSQAYIWRELVALYGLTQPAMNLQPRYNIAPTATIDVLIPRNSDELELWQMGWGLIPSWWTKTRKELPSTFNARAETVTARPMFRDAFRERRCIISASGYRRPRARWTCLHSCSRIISSLRRNFTFQPTNAGGVGKIPVVAEMSVPARRIASSDR